MPFSCFSCCFPGANNRPANEPLSAFSPGIAANNLSVTLNLTLPPLREEELYIKAAEKTSAAAGTAIRILINSTTKFKPLTPSSNSLKSQFNTHLDDCIANLLELKEKKFASSAERDRLLQELKFNNQKIADLVTNTLEKEKRKKAIPPLAFDEAEEKQELPLSIIPPSIAPPPVLVQTNLLYHDVRAPLHNIGLEIESYEQSNQSAEDSTLLIETLEKQYKELQTFILSIPEQNATEAQPLNAEHKPFTIKTLIHSVTRSTDASTKKRSMRLFFYHPTLPDTESFSGDMSKISHILTNFINNATKYCSRGTEIKVRISVDPTLSPSHSTLRFEVEDNGPGISDEKKRKLFAPFSQGDSLADNTQQSSGVGLYLSSQYAKVLNPGTPLEEMIGVKDSIPKGSCFWFTARLKKTQPIQSPVFSPVGVKLKFNDNNVTILVADDSESIQKTMSRVIETAGCKKGHYNTAESGEKVLELYEERDYQVIFIDENMGSGMSGCETAKTLLNLAKKTFRAPPHIIVTSGETKVEIHEKLQNLGLLGKVSILSKPCSYSAIVQTVNDLTASSN